MKMNEKTTNKWKWFLLLHFALFVYSTCGICSKMAARQTFFSLPFFMYYAGMIAILGIYAILWQQVLKHMAVTTAFANKAVTVVWGIILGRLIFQETVSMRQLIGAAIIIAGAVLYVRSDLKENEQNE